jgi:hypothetical protein
MEHEMKESKSMDSALFLGIFSILGGSYLSLIRENSCNPRHPFLNKQTHFQNR